MFIVIALANYISAGLNFSSPLALGLLALAIPFFLPMVIYRGLTQTDAQDAKLHKTALKSKETIDVKALSVTALPYIILQAAQVCSTILQPYIAKQKDGAKSQKELFTLLLIIGAITAAALVIIVPNSGLVVKVMLGREYAALSSIVWISALTGAVFIMSHLCAIYQIAKGQTRAAQIVLGFGIFQFVSLATVNHFFSGIGIHSYFSIKLAIQFMCAICLAGSVIRTSKRAALEG